MCAVHLFMGLTPLLLYLTRFCVSRCFSLIFQCFFGFSILYYIKYNLPSIYSSIAKFFNYYHKKRARIRELFHYNYSSISISSSNSSTSSTSSISSISYSSTISSANSSAVASAVIASNSASTSSFTSW